MIANDSAVLLPENAKETDNFKNGSGFHKEVEEFAGMSEYELERLNRIQRNQQIMQNMGIFEGSRDDVVFHYCVYAKKKFGPGEWQNKVMEFNTKYCQPPMSYDQVKAKIDQHVK